MKTIISILLVCITIPSIAQISMTSEMVEICTYEGDRTISSGCELRDLKSLFTLSEGETMIMHTLETSKTTYYIDRKEVSDDGKAHFFFATDTGGYKYIFVIDSELTYVKIAMVKDNLTYTYVFAIVNTF